LLGWSALGELPWLGWAGLGWLAWLVWLGCWAGWLGCHAGWACPAWEAQGFGLVGLLSCLAMWAGLAWLVSFLGWLGWLGGLGWAGLPGLPGWAGRPRTESICPDVVICLPSQSGGDPILKLQQSINNLLESRYLIDPTVRNDSKKQPVVVKGALGFFSLFTVRPCL
jgi:hypothetical protein